MEYGNCRFPGRAEFLRVARPSMKAVQGILVTEGGSTQKKGEHFKNTGGTDGTVGSIYRSYQCVCVPIHTVYNYCVYIYIFMIVFG